MAINFTFTLSAQDPETLDHGDVKLEYAPSLKILEFNSNKPFKVVVTEDFSRKHAIKLKALDPTFSANYTWELGSGSNNTFMRYWNLYPNEFEALDGVSYINGTFSMPVNNSDFGKTNGVIRVKDNSGETALHQAQVFFEKDAPSFWNPAEPNWSYYWKQFVDKKLISSLNFLPDAELKLVCGEKAIACTAATTDKKCYYRQLASEYAGYTSNQGIHTFIEILAHENHHIVLFNYFWPNGYNPDNSRCQDGIGGSNADCDNDKYPTWFEISQEGMDWGFDPTDDTDKYDYQVTGRPDWWSIGRSYEEAKCVEVQRSANFSINDQHDWSYDKKNTNQGKQFKK